MVSQRGQEEAPFELLIAVIIMGFVIFLGLQAMDFVSKEKCKAEIKYSANELKIVLQEVVAGNIKSLVFSPPQCFSKPKDREEMFFVVIKDTLQCSHLCGRAKDQCFVFKYSSLEYSYELCFETVSPQTSFYEQEPCCGDGTSARNCEEFKVIAEDLTTGISRGAFEFVNKSSSTDAFPKICAYLKKSGS